MFIKNEKRKQRAVIFGAGMAGQRAYIRLKGEYDIIAYMDNDKQKHGQKVMDLPIWSIESFSEIEDHHLVEILVASEFAEQIFIQLQSELASELKITILPASKLSAFHFGDSKEIHENALSVLKTVVLALNKHQIKHHIDAGTLLGLYREQRLIAWDDDLDIAIDSDELDTLKSCLTNIESDLKLVTKVNWRSDVYYASQAFGNVVKGAHRNIKFTPESPMLPCLDMFIKYRCAQHSDYVLASRGIRMPAKLTDQLYQKELAGFDWWVPAETENYLTEHYGEWKTPKSDWSISDLTNTSVF